MPGSMKAQNHNIHNGMTIIMTLRPPFQKNYWFLIIIFTLFSIASGIVVYFINGNQNRVIKEEKLGRLGTIADFKIRQISHRREGGRTRAPT